MRSAIPFLLLLLSGCGPSAPAGLPAGSTPSMEASGPATTASSPAADPTVEGLLTLLEAPVGAADPASEDSEALRALFEADQADRGPETLDPSTLPGRDAARREQALALIAGGELHSAADHLHAAMLFQHGGTPEAYARAHALAIAGLRLHPAAVPLRWLAAASLDRWLQATGQPQVFGTQSLREGNGPWSMEPYDPSPVTDAQRALADVPSLADQRAHLAQLNQGGRAPGMAPQGAP
mgnify:CR=1 FL=1